MSRVLVNLEIIVEMDDLLMSEVETAMHKMLSSLEHRVNVYDYGLDMEMMD